MSEYDVIIIGGGTAGLAAALYSIRFSLKTLLISKDLGGTGNEAHLVDNWIGEPGVTGIDLMQKFIDHVKKYNVPLITDTVKEVKKSGKKLNVITEDNKEYTSKTIIFANGMKHRELNVKGEKEFAGKGVHYCYTCLTPETNIVTNPGLKEIKDVENEKVLTNSGKFKNFKEKIRVPYNGKVLSIGTRHFRKETTLTPNHRVLALKRSWPFYKSLDERKKLKPKWIPSGELRKGDYVTYPRINKIKDIKYLNLEKNFPNKKVDNKYIQEHHKTHTSKKIPKKIKFTKDLLRLFGYYISEGNNSHNGIMFSFNKKETSYIGDVINTIKKRFRVECKKINIGKVTRVYCYSKILKELFTKFFGSYAHEKRLPQDFIYLPKEKQKELIKGMWRGDGCISKKSYCYVTNSPILAHQLKLVLMRFGILPRFEVRKREKLTSSYIDDREIKFNHDKYHIYITGPYLKIGEEILDIKHPRTNNRNRVMYYGWLDNDYAYLPIKDIKESYYNGFVYDLTVKNYNSYTTENMIVHNCDGPLFKDKVVGVVGGSDSATLGAIFLKDYAKKVYVIYRGDKLRAEPISAKQVYNDKKIEVIHKANVKEIYGENLVKGVKLDTEKDLKLDGVFIEIGHIPLTDMAKKLKVKLDQGGFIKVTRNQETNINGVFAAGDMTDATTLKQFITSASEGSVAAQSAYHYIIGKQKSKKKEVFR